MRAGSPMRFAWPVALSGFLPPFCGTPWLPGGNAGSEAAAGSAGTAAGTARVSVEAGDVGAGADADPNADTTDSSGALEEPVLGCSAGVWPAQASFELLPLASIPGSSGPVTVTGSSANGEAVIGYTLDLEDPENPETSASIPHPVLFDGSSWQTVLPEAVTRSAVVNCDGSVVAGEYDRLIGFIKRRGRAPVFLVGKGQWATVPQGISADGTRILGNLVYRGDSWGGFTNDPVVWSDLGVASYLWPARPLMALHLTFDGKLIAGTTDACGYPRPPARCGQPEQLFTSTGRPNLTLHGAAPTAIMSSDGSTFAGDEMIAPEGDDLYVVHVFRRASGRTVAPCVGCWALDLSSRGNILLFRSSASTPFLWTQLHGIRSVIEIANESGASIPYSVHLTAVDMSDDGRVIVGHAQDRNSPDPANRQGFRITFSRQAYD